MVAENEEVVFVCVAEGFPAPTITWQHAGRVVTNDNRDFEVNLTVSQTGFTRMITSYLTISSANSSMNGEVKCIAKPPPPQYIGRRRLDAVSTSTQLTVLGKTASG